MNKFYKSSVMHTLLIGCFLMVTSFAVAQQNMGRNNCDYTVIMHKNTAPTGIGGWEGASIMFFGEGDTYITSCTLEDGDYGEVIVSLPQEEIVCKWMPGNDDYWINFEIIDPLGDEIFSGWGGGLSNPFFTFTSACSLENPAMPENFILRGSENGLEATLSWTNPATTQSGNPTTLSAVSVLRNGQLVQSFENPEAGAEVTWIDSNVPLPGIYTYSVYAVNEVGESPKAVATDTIGAYAVVPTTGSLTVNSCACFVTCELSNIGLYPTNYNGVLIINPCDEGKVVTLAGHHHIYDGFMGGEKDHLYVYDGVGTEGTLLGDFTDSCWDGDTLNVTSISGPVTIHFVTGVQGGCQGFEICATCTEQTSVNELDNSKMTVYPNPADNQIIVEADDVETLTLFDGCGRKIATTNDKMMNTSDIKGGVYILNVRTHDGQNYNKSVVILH